MQTVRLGSKGEDVRKLQRWLNRSGYAVGKEDGGFGPITELGVK